MGIASIETGGATPPGNVCSAAFFEVFEPKNFAPRESFAKVNGPVALGCTARLLAGTERGFSC
jgi:hypothetical protein